MQAAGASRRWRGREGGKEEGAGREVQICTAGLSGRRGNASRACWLESPRGLAPPKTTPHLNPCPHCPRATPLPLPSSTPPHYLRGRPKFKALCIYNFFFIFCCMSCFFGGGAILSRPPYEDLPNGGGIWGLRKKLAQLHTCTDCITFKLPDSKIWTHTRRYRKYSQTRAFSDQSLFRPELTGRRCLSFIHPARVCGVLY